jgi:molecular chaperone DnaJ
VFQDNEIREKKNACYADIEKYVAGHARSCFAFDWLHLIYVSDGLFLPAPRSGLWGFACRSSATEKENCVLRCTSPECYNLIYGGDPVSGGAMRVMFLNSCFDF